jgi:type 1 glutamine amidotransferase
MRHCLENIPGMPDLKAEVFQGWPQDPAALEQANSLVFIGDTFPPMRLPDADMRLKQLSTLMDKGTGMVCIHYATGLEAKDVAPDGDHPLLRWVGGYFATKCAHHQSIARIFEAATITPAAPEHPVCRGWQTFTFKDEPYINNYFGKEGNQPAPGVTIFATAMLPPENPKREAVSWGIQRPDGGRGFAVVMPHFYKNWTHPDLRTLILNGIVWTAKVDLPAGGINVPAPDLTAFDAASIEPKPRPKNLPAAPAPAPQPMPKP